MDGIHLLGEWYGCPAAHARIHSRQRRCARLCLEAVARRGAHDRRRRASIQFEPQGVTGTVLLAESHLAIHTWPEHGFVTIDVYVCNLATDNSDKGEGCSARSRYGVEAARTKYQAIHRGSMDG